LEAWYEIEALTSLANYSSSHPGHAFPELLPVNAQPVLELTDLGHPLIHPGEVVTNDFILPGLGEIILITGSNMSGKSTFLRTVGAALVLAFAGSPVPARRMRTIPFRLFTSMNVTDSLSDGISFFYAEVRRLKALLDALEADHAFPLLFLIDEIFRGTNNRERQIGSWAYTRALAGRNGTGFLSTHDLELANLAGENSLIKNFHFRETIQDGKMVFDFKIHPGASPTTNALRIMALAGLPLPSEKERS
jgi:DNA mismatch repair ATPase MutS